MRHPLLSFAIASLLTNASLGADTPSLGDTSSQEPALPGHIAILAGGGQSFPGWGKTTERVRTIDLTLRYAGLINRPHDFGFIRTREQLWIELPILFVYEPDNAPILSMNFLYCCLFEQFDTWQPYFTAGGGPVYAIADIPGMGSRLCGNYQAGVGIRVPTAGRAIHIEARFHHISNLGAADPNVPINSLRGLLGVSWDF